MYNPHEILGVEESDDLDTIKQRFKKVSKMFHPDKHQQDASAVALYQIIRSSYDSLKESKKKISLPVMEPTIKQSSSTQKTKQEVVVEGTNITENDIRILGERLKDPWFHPEFQLTEFFSDVMIPEKKK